MENKRMKYSLIILTLLPLIILAACTQPLICNKPYIQHEQSCCLDQNENRVCDNDESSTTTSEITPLVPSSTDSPPITVSKPESIPLFDYNLINTLQKTIGRITYNDASWTQVTRDSPYFDLGHQKLATIQTLQAPIKDGQDFKTKFAGRGWKSTDHYLNTTVYDLLFKPMVESEFESPTLYKKYKQDSVFIERKIDEQAIETPNGVVLEYQELNWRHDEYGYFKGEYQPNLLIYKIFCSPSVVVYLSPSKDDLDLNLLTATIENAHDVWNQNVVRLRPGMLQKVQKVMQECPTPSGGTNELQGFTYTTSQTYVDHYPTYLYYHWDINTKITPDIIRSAKHTSLNAINKIEVVVENKEIYDLDGPILIDIRVSPDTKPQEYLVRDKKVTGRFLAGDTISRVFIPFEPIEFDQKLDIEVRLYTEDGGYYIRPQNFVLNY